MTTNVDERPRSEGHDDAPERVTGSTAPAASSDDPSAAGATPGRGGLHAYIWSPDGMREATTPDEIEKAYADQSTHLWIDVQEDAVDVLSELARCLGLHPLIVEDITERNQRAKIEQTGDVTHLVMFALLYEDELLTDEVDIVLGARFLITAHGGKWEPTRAPHFRTGVEEFLKGGTDYVLWAVVDNLVDGYFPVFDRLGDEIDSLQAEVIRRPDKALIERLFQLRRDLLHIRHAVTPQREIFNQLTNRTTNLVSAERIIYFRDVYDHLIRLTDELDSYRELVTTTLDAYLSTVNNNLSEVMKRLTAVTVVLAGIAAIAGIFGASEASAAFAGQEGPGFWIMTVLSVTLGGAALAYFRHTGWI